MGRIFLLIVTFYYRKRTCCKKITLNLWCHIWNSLLVNITIPVAVVFDNILEVLDIAKSGYLEIWTDNINRSLRKRMSFIARKIKSKIYFLCTRCKNDHFDCEKMLIKNALSKLTMIHFYPDWNQREKQWLEI